MGKEEVDRFLENRLILQLGTIDDEGDPNIGPVWFKGLQEISSQDLTQS